MAYSLFSSQIFLIHSNAHSLEKGLLKSVAQCDKTTGIPSILRIKSWAILQLYIILPNNCKHDLIISLSKLSNSSQLILLSNENLIY